MSRLQAAVALPGSADFFGKVKWMGLIVPLVLLLNVQPLLPFPSQTSIIVNGTSTALNLDLAKPIHDSPTFVQSVPQPPPPPFYSISLTGKAKAGSLAILENRITNQGQGEVQIINLSFTTDFAGNYTSNLALPFQLLPGENRTWEATLGISSFTSPGNHTLTGQAAWQYYSATTSSWYTGGTVQEQTTIPVTSSSLLTINLGPTEILGIGGGFVGGVLLLVFLVVRHENRRRHTMNNPPLSPQVPVPFPQTGLPSLFGGKSIPLHPEDEKIIGIARELCQQLNLNKYSPWTISWVNRMGLYRLPPDHVGLLRDRLVLPAYMQNQLEPQEWRPLLASAILFYTSLSRKMMRLILTTFLPVVVIVFSLTILSFRLIPEGSKPSTLVLVAPAAYAALLILPMIRLFRHQKNWLLETDRKVADTYGKELFLSTLVKIQTLNPTRKKRGLMRASLSERIANLK